MEHRQQYDMYRRAVEEYLDGLFKGKRPYGVLQEAMRYSLLAGGKRVRPVLTLAFCDAMGGDWRAALPFACALELVHTYSLIHDDLPCMDDDDLRRGKPTCHKVYGETLAVLAGDALQGEAFGLIAGAAGMTDRQKVEAVALLAAACAGDGMVAGQVLDTLHEPKTQEELTEVHRLKTGAMIAGACMLGVAAASGSDTLRAAAEEYGYKLGLAFQIRDDMLDVVGDEATFGKPIGSDAGEGKVTFVDLLGIEGCEAAVMDCTRQACAAVEADADEGFLAHLAEQLAGRNK